MLKLSFLAALLTASAAPLPSYTADKQPLNLTAARELFNKKDYERAIPLYKKSVALDPKNARIHYELGLALFAWAEKVSEKKPQYRQTAKWAQFSRQLDQLFEQSVDEFTTAIKIDPRNTEAYISRASAYSKLAKHDKALLDAKAILMIDPKCAFADRACADELTTLGRHQEALAYYDDYIRMRPADFLGFYLRAMAYEELGKAELALADYSKSINLSPNQADPHLRRGLIYDALRKHDLAVRDYDAYIKLRPDDFRGYQLRAIANGLLGNRDASRADFAKANSLKPKGR